MNIDVDEDRVRQFASYARETAGVPYSVRLLAASMEEQLPPDPPLWQRLASLANHLDRLGGSTDLSDDDASIVRDAAIALQKVAES